MLTALGQSGDPVQSRAAGEPGLPCVQPAVPHRRTNPARSCPATPTPPATRRSCGCSSGTRMSCATWASRWRPAGPRRFDPSEGYRINRDAYALPDIDLTPTRPPRSRWPPGCGSPRSWSAAAQGAVLKLRAAGVEVDTENSVIVQPRVRATEPALIPLISAVQAGRVVTFPHRKHPAESPTPRTVEPWGVVSWRGRWYVVGHDRNRDATRAIRGHVCVYPRLSSSCSARRAPVSWTAGSQEELCGSCAPVSSSRPEPSVLLTVGPVVDGAVLDRAADHL